MDRADYSIATPEEREKVITILQRNVNLMIEQKKIGEPQILRQQGDGLCERIRRGEVIAGADYKLLLSIFQQK
ncbi:MAG TPA: hypothetical protein VGA99_03340, partial [bacterium]